MRMVIIAFAALGASCTCMNELHRAATNNDAAGVHQAVRAGADPNAIDVCGNVTPLSAAAIAGSTGAIRALVQDGADLERGANPRGDSDGGTQLLRWAKYRNNPEVLDALKAHGLP